MALPDSNQRQIGSSSPCRRWYLYLRESIGVGAPECSSGGLRPPPGGGDTAATKGRAPLGPTKCRPQGRRYNSAVLSRERQDAPRERPPLAQSERFLDARRHPTRNL